MASDWQALARGSPLGFSRWPIGKPRTAARHEQVVAAGPGETFPQAVEKTRQEQNGESSGCDGCNTADDSRVPRPARAAPHPLDQRRRGDAFTWLGRPVAALGAYEEAARTAREGGFDSPVPLAQLGAWYAWFGRYEEAKALLDEALAAAGDDAAARARTLSTLVGASPGSRDETFV